MRIKDELGKLKKKDIYSLILYILYKFKDIPEYSSLSELAYILDKDSLLKFLQYFGGTTIQVPTIEEFEDVVYTLLLYQCINIENLNYEAALKMLDLPKKRLKKVKDMYVDSIKIISSSQLKSREINET